VKETCLAKETCLPACQHVLLQHGMSEASKHHQKILCLLTSYWLSSSHHEFSASAAGMLYAAVSVNST
jgi:hypothetical protein